MFSFLRGPDKHAGAPAPLLYVMGLKFTAHTKAERDELASIEEAIRLCGVSDIVLDKVETGNAEIAFWVHVANPKRAFKQLSELPSIAVHLAKLQAASAERTKMKFTILWPKGNAAHIPASLT